MGNVSDIRKVGIEELKGKTVELLGELKDFAEKVEGFRQHLSVNIETFEIRVRAMEAKVQWLISRYDKLAKGR